MGSSITLQTYHYFEGSVATGSLAPRLVGFLCESDRDFFHELTRVKGISFRKALRIMDLPVPQLAAAIAAGDEHLLTKLPDVGRKTAAQIVAELRDQVQPFTSGPVSEAPVLSDAQRQAVEVLVGWGDRRADAQRWVAEAVAVDGTLREPDQIVRAAYRLRARP